MKKLTIALIAVIMTFLPMIAANPASEVRAIWLTTNSGLDWPAGSYTESAQKKKLVEILDRLEDANFNTIIFQVQVKGDVVWLSKKQPSLISFTGNGSKNLSYDICRYVIDECHKRNMECHAWIVPYRIGTYKEADRYINNPIEHVSVSHPELVVEYQNALYLDPGLPETTEYLVDLYRELVTGYDFDGINFDYTRYPGQDFDDSISFSEYNPDKMALADWRRNNINNFIAQMYKMVKSVKPWMKVGAAPIGTYKNVKGYGNMTAYGSVYQDAAQWMQSGNHDLLIPQMYWNETYGFTPNMQTWVDNCAGRQLVIGLAPYKMVDSNNWAYTVVTDQIKKQRANPGTSGVCFFRTENVIGSHEKSQQLYNALKTDYFSTPAKIPAMTYLENTKPNAPVNVTLENNRLSWDAPELDKAGTPIKNYVVYSSTDGKFNTADASSIVCITQDLNATVPDASKEYAVTAIDRGNFESDIAIPAGTALVSEDATTEVIVSGLEVTVKSAADIKGITLYNMSGQNIGSTTGDKLSLPTYGIYMVNIVTENGNITKKIIAVK